MKSIINLVSNIEYFWWFCGGEFVIECVCVWDEEKLLTVQYISLSVDMREEKIVCVAKTDEAT